MRSKFLTLNSSLRLLALCAGLLMQTNAHASRNGIPVEGEYPAVALICGFRDGTGVLISKNLILTANHVTGDFNLNWTYVFLNYPSGGPVRIVDKRVLSTDWRNELVLLKLEKPVALSPVPILVDIESLPTGTDVFSVGFGLNGNETMQRHRPVALRANMIFAGFFDIFEIEKDGDPVSSPSVNPARIMVQTTPGATNQMSCHGDSGSPTLIQVGDKLKLVGILSHLLADNHDGSPEDKCRKAHTVRVVPIAPHLQWLKQAASEMGAEQPVAR